MTSSSTPRHRESFKLEPPPGFKTCDIHLPESDIVAELETMVMFCDDDDIEFDPEPVEITSVAPEDTQSLIDEIDEEVDSSLMHACVGPSAGKPRRIAKNNNSVLKKRRE
ncbi:hypothetical protein P9112_013756 [Eukaryota sp. TZLM1-RC]